MPRELRRLVGVYDAGGTALGELTYFVGKRLGRAHCGLCDITHGTVRERPEWRAARDRLGVPFETFHRDDQPASVRAATAGTVPVVVAESVDGEITVLAGPQPIDACAGSPERLVKLIESALVVNDLARPTAPA